MKKDRLTKRFNGSPKLLSEMLGMIAFNIEDGLLLLGAKPGVDYTYVDLLALAEPYVRKRWNNNHLDIETTFGSCFQ